MYFVGGSLIEICLMFSHDRQGIHVFGRRTPEEKYKFYHILPREHTTNITYYCWFWGSVCQISPLSSYSFSPFPCRSLWKEVTLSLCLLSGELCSTSLRAEYLHKLFGILHEKFIHFSSLIPLFNHLFVSVDAHGYLSTIHSWICNPILLNFIAEVVPALATTSSSVASCVSNILH